MSKKNTRGAPYSYFQDMLASGSWSPSTIHTHDSLTYWYFFEYLLQKAISIFKFDSIPDTWDLSYFQYVLFCNGFVSVIDTEKYGPIPQKCTLTGRNIYELPSRVIITNALLPEYKELVIGEECALIKLMPDYGNVLNICGMYADMLACCLETAGVSLVNSKLAYVFMADNKAMAESFKKMFDKISAGEPIVVADKGLYKADGEKAWDYFMQNIGANYIAGDVLNDMRTLMNMFNTEIGIRNANTQKRERLISDEVQANDEETHSKVFLWLDEIRKGLDTANKLFNLNLSVYYRYERSESYDSSTDELPWNV